MYQWLWHRLPGGTASKAACAAILAIAAVALLWFVIFPWVTPQVPLDHVMPGSLSGAAFPPCNQRYGGFPESVEVPAKAVPGTAALRCWLAV